MKRRDFLTRSTVAAGLAGSTQLLPPLTADQGDGTQIPHLAPPVVAQPEIRSAAYLRRAREDKLLPKAPVSKNSAGLAVSAVSPMPLAERIKRNVVPRHGFCSISPATDA